MRILKRLQAVRGLFFLLACLFGGTVSAQALPPEVIQALTRTDIPAAAAGIYLQEVHGDHPPVTLNATAPFNPASTMKLVTTNAALELLGPVYTWKTQAYASALQVGDVLHGDLIIKGSGDPKLVLEKFWLFLREIRSRGIREIRGNLLLDRSLFEQGAHDAALFDGDPLRVYNVGPDALLLNFKALNFRFVPNEAGAAVNVTIDPPIDGYPVIAPRLSNGECGDWKSKLQGVFNGHDSGFSGAFSLSCGERSWHVHPYQMTQNQYFEAVFRKMWTELGGTLIGEVKNGEIPVNARLVGESESAPLSEVIRDINKYSNNVMARQLLLTLAADVFKLPANAERGAQVLKTWMNRKNISAPELVIENGSGLSRVERISAETLGRMLVAAFRSPVMPEFISSLPLAGHDGTMRRRLTTRTAAGNAHIKTGSLTDVRAIAGYVLAASGKRYALVFIINHPNAPAAGHEAQDALLQWVYERG
ncbi:MAG: D-alanyl-D-alanine carboxypeptidase/D-alanyl-D-alanine-endopeptidase [Burkholderiales bacterium RIFCSPLOWO2_02_FULL_57_36]|nr:MAG: D-alanyl-D-alanine carboxypeptidase/D-alanyl-D-alanine-endopeptidase [Burkholderiales bacterium RIFCSPLOWO2_02_FULL_57_36]